MRYIYSLLLILLSPLLIAYTFMQKKRRGGDRRFVLQRLGLFARTAAIHDQPAIWFHAASVGETNSIIPLVRSLGAANPQLRQVITTNTPEAARIVQSAFGTEIQHYYFTTDFPAAARRLVRSIQPLALFVVETEIWPNLYHHCFHEHIPVVIVNARLSPKTINSNRFIKALYRQTLSGVTAFLARSRTDADHYIKLGAKPERVTVLGNIKFSAALQKSAAPLPELINREYLLAISTHAGEEKILASMLRELQQQTGHTDLLLVIAPRHPQRSTDIRRELAHLELNVSVRSQREAVTDTTDIYLVDTVGEINALLAGQAKAVFVGGSLVPLGGHNVLEPAIYGKPTLTGPHTENFRDEMQLLRSHDAVIEADSATALQTAFDQLLQSPARQQELGDNALEAIRSCHGILEQYHNRLQNLLQAELATRTASPAFADQSAP